MQDFVSTETLATAAKRRPRYAPCAVFGSVLGTMWRVVDRTTSPYTYVQTIPPRFMAYESARACADNLNESA